MQQSRHRPVVHGVSVTPLEGNSSAPAKDLTGAESSRTLALLDEGMGGGLGRGSLSHGLHMCGGSCFIAG